MTSGYLEFQYEVLDDFERNYGLVQLGPMSSFTYNDDPKRLCFVLSRYKFVAKIFNGYSSVLEVGCGDAFGSRLVRQHVDSMTVSDMDSRMIDSISARPIPARFSLSTHVWDPVTDKNPFRQRFDGVFALDVLEHVPSDVEHRFLRRLLEPLAKTGTLVLGMPSIESQVYASPASKAGHINCKTQEDLVSFCRNYFDCVFAFSMNDEVVHTGYSRMANYIFVVCSMKKENDEF